jgi:hypothetical protein
VYDSAANPLDDGDTPDIALPLELCLDITVWPDDGCRVSYTVFSQPEVENRPRHRLLLKKQTRLDFYLPTTGKGEVDFAPINGKGIITF